MFQSLFSGHRDFPTSEIYIQLAYSIQQQTLYYGLVQTYLMIYVCVPLGPVDYQTEKSKDIRKFFFISRFHSTKCFIGHLGIQQITLVYIALKILLFLTAILNVSILKSVQN